MLLSGKVWDSALRTRTTGTLVMMSSVVTPRPIVGLPLTRGPGHCPQRMPQPQIGQLDSELMLLFDAIALMGIGERVRAERVLCSWGAVDEHVTVWHHIRPPSVEVENECGEQWVRCLGLVSLQVLQVGFAQPFTEGGAWGGIGRLVTEELVELGG